VHQIQSIPIATKHRYNDISKDSLKNATSSILGKQKKRECKKGVMQGSKSCKGGDSSSQFDTDERAEIAQINNSSMKRSKNGEKAGSIDNANAQS